VLDKVGEFHRDCLLFGISSEDEFLCSKTLLYLAVEKDGDI